MCFIPVWIIMAPLEVRILVPWPPVYYTLMHRRVTYQATKLRNNIWGGGFWTIMGLHLTQTVVVVVVIICNHAIYYCWFMIMLLLQLQFWFECDLHFIIARLTCCLLQNRLRFIICLKLNWFNIHSFLI